MILAFTGHRNLFNVDFIRASLETLLLFYKPKRCVSGMAIGFDMLAAEAALNHQIPLTAAIPFPGQRLRWKKDQQDRWAGILSKADHVNVISGGPYYPELLSRRNDWMVDFCDRVIACWCGAPGGTRNCIESAMEAGRPIDLIDPSGNLVPDWYAGEVEYERP
uniref:DNA recombination-mediator protein A n=2 Tax=viral metagenome TaxID=1070528 RepID=A0A6H2A078_9ZZZZ